MRALSLTLALIVAAIAFAACDDDGDEYVPPTRVPPTAVPTATPVPEITITQPEPADGYPWEARLTSGSRYFIYDSATDTFQSITHVGAEAPRWIDDDELYVTRTDGEYRVRLNGAVSRFIDIPPNPRQPPPSEVSSALGWQVAGYSTEDRRAPVMIVRNAASQPVYLINNGSTPMWASDGRHLRFRGNLCGTDDILSLDVDSGQLTNLTSDVHAIWSLAPGPGARSVTLEFLSSDQNDPGAKVELLAVDDGQRARLF